MLALTSMFFVMQRVFKDPKLQIQLENDGFLTVPFLSPDEVNDLRVAHERLHVYGGQGTHVSMFVPDYAYRKSVDEVIKQAFARSCNALFDDHKMLYANFMMKEPDEHSEFPVHQDWTYVDESKWRSIAVWCPLQDCDEQNGTLQMLKGSHKFITAPRGPFVDWAYQGLEEEIKQKYLTNVPLKAGEAVIWEHRVVHYSPPNVGKETRLAATVILTPNKAKTYHYLHRNEQPTNQLDRLTTDTDFYLRYKIGELPDNFADTAEAVKIGMEKLNAQQLAELYKKHNQTSVLDRILSFFKKS